MTDFICQLSSRVGTWTLRAWSLSSTLRWSLFILIFLKYINKNQSVVQYGNKQCIKSFLDSSLTCAVTTLSPLVALAKSNECCSSLVRLLTVLLGDNRPEGSRASLLTEQSGDTGGGKHTTDSFI